MTDTAAFAPLPDKGRPGEQNAALDEIDVGGRWRAARRTDQPTTTAATVHGVWEGEYEADLTCLHADLASAMACAADAERHNGRYVEVHEHRVETAGDHE